MQSHLKHIQKQINQRKIAELMRKYDWFLNSFSLSKNKLIKRINNSKWKMPKKKYYKKKSFLTSVSITLNKKMKLKENRLMKLKKIPFLKKFLSKKRIKMPKFKMISFSKIKNLQNHMFLVEKVSLMLSLSKKSLKMILK